MANNIFIDFLPPWVETGIQPAFYDKESGTVLQQTARMYHKVNELIAGENAQNEAITNCLEKFIELKDYVEHYLDNLDIQTEVNNKLDEMVEDGTLAEIINQEIFGELNEAKTGWINVTTKGLVADGVTANDTAFTTLLGTINDGDVIYFPKGTYLFNSRIQIDDFSNVTFRFEGELKSENGILLSRLVRCNFFGLRITRDYTRYDYTSLSNTGIEVFNSKYLNLTDTYVAGYNKGIFWHSDGQSNSYNTLYNFHSFDNLHGWSTLNENSGFTNEINTFGGRFSLNTGETDVAGIADFVVIPSQTNMQNFYGMTMEGELTKISIAGNYNSFIGCRFEGQSSNNQDIVLTGGSNTILGCYWSELSGGSNIINTGDYNIISSNRQLITDKYIPKNIETVTANYTLRKAVNLVRCDCTSGQIKVTLSADFRNAKNSIVRIQKVDYSPNGVTLSTTGQNYYQFIGRGVILKRMGDYVDMYFDGTTWWVSAISNMYTTSFPTTNKNNVVEGFIYQDGNNQKIVTEGGTVYGSQITNTYCSTTASSADIGLIIGNANAQLEIGNYIEINGESGYFQIIALDLPNLTATLNRACTNTNANTRITYHKAVHKYLGLIYDKVDSNPATGNIGDIVIYNTPTAGGYIGAVYTASGWKGFGAIEA